MSDTIIIWAVIIIIIGIQTCIFWDTLKKIRLYKATIPKVKFFATKEFLFFESEFGKVDATNFMNYRVDPLNKKPNWIYVEVTLVICSTPMNTVLLNILTAINTYLLRNKGAVSDFNLIKDVVERNTDSVDEQINAQLPIPLYLGLMGTMLGIIIGLIMMPSISDTQFENSIAMLIGGVSIAMGASLVGLLLTTINSGLFYKGAKAEVEELKNGFYTMIQTELLPVLSQNATSSIVSLQQNLHKFNDGFAANMVGFNDVLKRILGSFDGQVEMMQDIKKIDVVTLAKLNVNVFKELRESSKEFEKFNAYLSQVNSFVDNATQLNFQIGEQLGRTKSIETVVEAISENIGINKLLMDTLQADSAKIEERKQYINAVSISVDENLKKSFEQVQEDTHAKITALKEITKKEVQLVEDLLRQDVNNFDELKHISKMRESFDQMRVADQAKSEQIQVLIASQDAKIDRVISEISNLVKEISRRETESNQSTNIAKEAGNNESPSQEVEIIPKPLQYAIYGGVLIAVLFMCFTVYSSISSTKEATPVSIIEQPKNK